MRKIFTVLLIFSIILMTIACQKQNEPAHRSLRVVQRTADPNDGSPVQKYALVIGNGDYGADLGRLANPRNDADDITLALESLGFNVDKRLNANHDEMEEAILRLKDRLSRTANSYGFFFFAGHGVQSGGDNFLIPVGVNIRSEAHLGQNAVSVRTMLQNLRGAGNSLNIVVLDACRNNPFVWARSVGGGLAGVSPVSNSIIVYATSEGDVASDGEGRNGLFTSQLLNNLRTPSLSVREVFDKTGLDVQQLSNGQQLPAIYSQFFGTAYLGAPPTKSTTSMPAPAVPAQVESTSTTATQVASTQVVTAPVAIDPLSAEARESFNRGLSFSNRGFWDSAIIEYNKVIGQHPDYSLTYINRGEAYFEKRQYNLAINDFQRAMELDPNDANAYNGRGNSYLGKRNFLEVFFNLNLNPALADFNRAIDIDSNNAAAYFSRAYANLHNQGFFDILFNRINDRVIADFDEAIRLNPNYAQAYFYRGRAYQQRGNTAKALEGINIARELGYNP